MKNSLDLAVCMVVMVGLCGGSVFTCESCTEQMDSHDSKRLSEKALEPKISTVKGGRVRYCSTGYVGKKIEGKHMDLMNAVFENAPIAMVRMFKAAVAVKNILEETNVMKPVKVDEKTGDSVYFSTKEEEYNFIKNKIKGILDPIEKFLDEALKQSRSIVVVLFAKSLGENARQGYLLPAIDSDVTPAKYLVDNIKTIDDFKSAMSEFFIVFSDIDAGLSDNAKKAFDDTLKKLQLAQKKKNETK